jgi:hypothetical protein
MGSLKATLLVLALLAAGAHAWHAQSRPRANRQQYSQIDRAGFVPVRVVNRGAGDTVLILAPLHCPASAARRAKRLAIRLTQLGIPNMSSHSYRVRPSSYVGRDVDLTASVLGGDAPVVIIDGRGSANPTLAQILAEYRRSPSFAPASSPSPSIATALVQ